MEDTFNCPEREWHSLTQEPIEYPELYKTCYIKFSDGTTSISSLRETDKLDESGHKRKAWVTRFRDDIVAWSYYRGGYKVNGIYI